MNTMTTYSGRKFDPMQMTPGDVYIEDIAPVSYTHLTLPTTERV